MQARQVIEAPQRAVLQREVSTQPYPLFFVTISGAHLYGFPSPDSDFDLRGVHILPVDEVIGLDHGPETIESTHKRDAIEIDLVTHDVKKFFRLLLKKNGYVVEHIFSPLVVSNHPAFEELRSIAADCITKNHAHHYFGFARTQWALFEKERPRRVKPLLYVYRVLLTGIHLMQTGVVEANIRTLNERFQLSYVDDLVERKLAGPENATVDDASIQFFHAEYERLVRALEDAAASSALPVVPAGHAALHDLLIRLRRTTGA